MIQCCVLAFAASRLPLSARLEQPGERLAVHEMIVAQIVVMGMLFPFLLRDWRCAIVMLLTSWPFTQLAGLLTPIEPMRWIAAAMCVSIWIATLAIWRHLLRSQTAQLFGVAVATALTVGGPILWYLRAEFARPDPILNWSRDANFGPAMTALAQIASPFAALTWISLPALLFLSVIALAGKAANSRSR